MIKNQWYAILASKEIRRGRLTGVTRMGEQLVAWRDEQGRPVVQSERCPHRGVALSLGQVHNGCLQCPFHGFEFDPGGKCTLIPANGRSAEPPKAMHLQTYPTREAHGLVFIWWGDEQPEYPPLPWFEAVPAGYVPAVLVDPWPIHYSRGIENQLDVVHLPFVHGDSIGRGNRTLVNGPLVRTGCDAAGEIINVWVDNDADAGQKPLSGDDMDEPARHPSLQFRFPNLWHNWISEDFHLIGAFAPVDDQRMVLYILTFHAVRLPVLRQIFEWLMNRGNYHIERQDRRVVITQVPSRSDLNIGEVLIRGDGPIITYRKIRRRLIENSPGNRSEN